MQHFLGIDYGSKRIGLSYGDALGVAVPLPPVLASQCAMQVEKIAEVVERYQITDFVIGYPLSMNDTRNQRTQQVDGFIEALKIKFHLPVHPVDERLTSFQAAEDIVRLKIQKKKTQRSVRAQKKARSTGKLDSRAAALILQDFLEARKPTER